MSIRSYRAGIAAVALVLGPLLMSIGDLLHPDESMHAAAQATIVLGQASRWYAAHLLLFAGILVFIPGLLAVTSLTAEHRPTAGYIGRILLLVGVGSFAAVFVGEMLIGRYATDGAGITAVTALLETFQSAWVLGAVIVGAIAFFVGLAVATFPLVMASGPLRWPALVLELGAVLILAEIITAQVLLSQIGNIAMFVGSVAFARQILRGDKFA